MFRIFDIVPTNSTVYVPSTEKVGPTQIVHVLLRFVHFVSFCVLQVVRRFPKQRWILTDILLQNPLRVLLSLYVPSSLSFLGGGLFSRWTT